MSTELAAASRRRVLIVALPILVVLGGAAFWLTRPSSDGFRAAMKAAAPAIASSAGGADDNSGSGILLGLAKGAVDERRLVAPAGANAYEFYLSVLQLEPENAIAMAGLRDLFEPAADDIERSINDNNLDEAQRELSLLREFDGTNYKLALLGGKLDAQRQIQIREDEAKAAIIQAQAAAAAGQQ